MFLPHQHLESSQLVLLVLLLHSNRQHRSLFGLQPELILVLPRKDVLQVGDLFPFSNGSQLLQLLVAENDGVEEGNVGLAGQLDLEALRVEEKTLSTCCMVMPLIGLSLWTKTARASMATLISVGL